MEHRPVDPARRKGRAQAVAAGVQAELPVAGGVHDLGMGVEDRTECGPGLQGFLAGLKGVPAGPVQVALCRSLAWPVKRVRIRAAW